MATSLIDKTLNLDVTTVKSGSVPSQTFYLNGFRVNAKNTTTYGKAKSLGDTTITLPSLSKFSTGTYTFKGKYSSGATITVKLPSDGSYYYVWDEFVTSGSIPSSKTNPVSLTVTGVPSVSDGDYVASGSYSTYSSEDSNEYYQGGKGTGTGIQIYDSNYVSPQYFITIVYCRVS